MNIQPVEVDTIGVYCIKFLFSIYIMLTIKLCELFSYQNYKKYNTLFLRYNRNKTAAIIRLSPLTKSGFQLGSNVVVENPV